MTRSPFSFQSLLCSVLAVCLLAPALALAQSAATKRAVRNIGSAFNNLQLVPAFREGPVAGPQQQSARNLLRDLDSALGRAKREYEGIPAEERGTAEVVELARRMAELEAFRADVNRNLEGGAAASAGQDARFRAFRDETRAYAGAVRLLRDGARGSPDQIAAAAQQLAQLDALCRAKYPGISDDPKLSFALAIEPGTWCATAAGRDAIANGASANAVSGTLEKWVKRVDEATRKLSGNQGLLPGGEDPLSVLLRDREAGKAMLTRNLKPSMDAAGQTITPAFFAPLDQKLDAFAAEVDRLAATYSFPEVFHDGALESGATKRLASITKGKVLRIGLSYSAWSVSKNALGVPLERYRTGVAVTKTPGAKWCEQREFTKHETYTGGGQFANSDDYRVGAMRYQKCP